MIPIYNLLAYCLGYQVTHSTFFYTPKRGTCRNSLWHSGAIWQHRSGSTLTRVIPCCLAAPSHHPNKCWLFIKFVLRLPQFHKCSWTLCVTLFGCYIFKTTATYPYNDVIMGAIASQITSLTIFNSIVYSDPDQRKHESSASLPFVGEIHRGPVNSLHKWPVTRKMFTFGDVIMIPRANELIMMAIPSLILPAHDSNFAW